MLKLDDFSSDIEIESTWLEPGGPQLRNLEFGGEMYSRELLEVLDNPPNQEEKGSQYKSPSRKLKKFKSVVNQYREKYELLKHLEDEPVDHLAFERAMQFLLIYLVELGNGDQKPYLADSDEGSVDIVWRSPRRTILVNVPSRDPVYFSAADGNFTLTGYIPDDCVEKGLLDWIRRK